MVRIGVIRTGELPIAASTPGIVRERAFEHAKATVIRSRVSGGIVSAWHHHGDRNLYGYVVSGRARVEYGKGGQDSAELGAGDFLHIPPRLVHRDVNPDPKQELVVVLFFTGSGPLVVNVESPES
jgi:uncharacterized RmlC-like cupin family protein